MRVNRRHRRRPSVPIIVLPTPTQRRFASSSALGIGVDFPVLLGYDGESLIDRGQHMKNIISIGALLLILMLAGCAIFKPYQPDVQQGNVIMPEMIQQLHVGMSPAQVEQVMEGPPILVTLFSSRTLYYVYTFRPGKGKTTTNQLRLTFVNGKLARIQRLNVCV